MAGILGWFVLRSGDVQGRERGWARQLTDRILQAEEPFHHYDAKHESFQDFPERMSKPDRGRYEIMRACSAALGNWPFAYKQNISEEKFVAIMNRVNANDGADLKTFEGCCELLVLLNDASKEFYDYPWVTELYGMAADGEIPPLPKLKPPPGKTPRP